MENSESSIPADYPLLGGIKITDKSQVKRQRRFFVGILSIILIPLELIAAVSAWETDGEIVRGIFIFMCLGVNTIAITLALMDIYKTGVILMVAFGLLLLWYQIPLLFRLHDLNAEAANIVSWAYSERLKTGSYPTDLSGYVYLYPKYAEHISGGAYGNDHFGLGYYITSPAVSHAFDTERGWSYYPD